MHQATQPAQLYDIHQHHTHTHTHTNKHIHTHVDSNYWLEETLCHETYDKPTVHIS